MGMWRVRSHWSLFLEPIGTWDLSNATGGRVVRTINRRLRSFVPIFARANNAAGTRVKPSNELALFREQLENTLLAS